MTWFIETVAFVLMLACLRRLGLVLGDGLIAGALP